MSAAGESRRYGNRVVDGFSPTADLAARQTGPVAPQHGVLAIDVFEQVDPNHYRALAHVVVDSGAGRSTAFHRSASASPLRHPVRARKRTTAMAAGQTRAASAARSAPPKPRTARSGD